MARGYDSILLYTKVGTDRKFRRLTPAERWCAVAGVWAIAAQSPVRGYLLITDSVAADEKDYAKEAGVSLEIARKTVKKMRDLGMIEQDSEMKAEHVHDWHEHQTDPKPSETRAAWRDRKRKSRDCPAGHVSIVPDCPAPLSKEKEREEPPSPPKGDRQRDRDRYEDEVRSYALALCPDVPETQSVGLVKHALGLLRANGKQPTNDEVVAYVHRWGPKEATA